MTRGPEPERGTGPGVITPDGCAVELYRLLPPMGEPEIVHAAIPAHADILELGAGAGRVTHALVALGHPVVAVDESAEMLACIRGAETVLAKIQRLRLDRRFDVVLLASQLVNVPDRALRRRFLETRRAHVRGQGWVLVQRHEPAWLDEAAEEERTPAGSPSGCATCAARRQGCSRPRPSTRRASGSGPRPSPPSGSTTRRWRPPWPRPGWRWTPT